MINPLLSNCVIVNVLLENNNAPTERVTIEQYNKKLDEAMERIDHGEFTTLEDLKKEMQTWQR